jgi:hypothetical protein
MHTVGGIDGSAAGDGARADRIVVLCNLAVRILPIDGASVTVVSGTGHRSLIVSSDVLAARLDELQSTLGEGPAFDAVAGGYPVLSGDLTRPAVRACWTVFGDAAIDIGARAVFALPLRIGAINLGVLVLHRRTVGEMSAVELSQALRLADAVAYAILDMAAPAANGHGATGRDEPSDMFVDSVFLGAEIHQASGMVMVQLGVPIDAALARLRSYAFAYNRPLIDVARDVIAHTLRLER